MKVCGLRDPAAVRVAVEAGADAIGVVMHPRSPRHVEDDTARALVAEAAGALDTVLVVKDMPALEAAQTARLIGADVVQLHGTYSSHDYAAARDVAGRMWRATHLDGHTTRRVGTYGEEVLLLDAPVPGSGERWDLAALQQHPIEGRWLLAGGLGPANVAEAIRLAQPWGVDVSSGVESAPGVKDHDLIRTFVAAARAAGSR